MNKNTFRNKRDRQNNRFIDINIFIYCGHIEEELDRHTKREGGSSTFSVGPTICDTYQVCGVHMECETIHCLGQPSVISPHIEAEIEGYIVLYFISSSVIPTILDTYQVCDVHMECETIH